MSVAPSKSGEAEVIVIVKAAPQLGHKHGETVCCAGIDLQGNWLRLYPVAFRTLEDGQKFGRWDRIHFRWRLPNDDHRPESRRVDQDSIRVVGELPQGERQRFLAARIVTSLNRERAAKRSLALLKAQILKFSYERKSDKEIQSERAAFAALRNQSDLFNTKPLIPYEPCPFKFQYRYQTDDGIRQGTCQDWEIEATFYNWRKASGEEKALVNIQRVFGDEYPKKGMLMAMGTHSLHPDTWLINGIVRLDDVSQMTLF
ncbi:MAG: hypothetical protein ING03_14895 [Roseomonas sp.]|nr:hypothetical protein [Roseomonas sp.]